MRNARTTLTIRAAITFLACAPVPAFGQKAEVLASPEPSSLPGTGVEPEAVARSPNATGVDRDMRQLLYRASFADPEVRSLISNGRLPEGEAQIRGRMTALESRKRGDSADWADDATRLAQILLLTKRADDAEPLMRRAVAIQGQRGNPAVYGYALYRLAEALTEAHEPRAGELVARRAIVVLATVHDRPDLSARAWAQLGSSIASQDLPGEAVVATTTAMQLAGRATGDAQLAQAIAGNLRSQQGGLNYSIEADARTRARLTASIASNGEAHPDTATQYAALADELRAQGKYDEAIVAALQALAIRERLGGSADPASIDQSLAILSIGERAPEPIAVGVARRALNTIARRKQIAEAARAGLTFGAAFPERVAKPARAPASMASFTTEELDALIDASRFAEAEALVRARMKSAAAAPEGMADTYLTDLESLGRILTSSGRNAEAAQSLRRLVALREKSGEAEPIARAWWRLAYALNGMADYRSAEDAARRAIAAAARSSDVAVPQASSYAELGAALAGQRRRPEAALAFQRAVELALARPSADGQTVAEIRNSQALNLAETGNLVEAETIYRQNLDEIVAKHGRGSIETARTLGLLADVLERRYKSDEAEPALLESIAIRERVLGDSNPRTIKSLSNYVGLLASAQRNAEALELQDRVMRLRAALPEVDVEDRIIDLGRMGEILANRKQIDEAIDYRRRALALARQKLDPGHQFIAIALRSLANALLSRNKSDPEYVALMREAVANARRERERTLLGSSADRRVTASRSLAAALSDTGQLDRTAFVTYRTALGLNGTYASNVRSAEPRMRAESFLIAQDLAVTEAGRAFSAIAVRDSLGDTAKGRLVRHQQDLVAELRTKSRDMIAASTGDPEAARRLRSEIEALETALATANENLRRQFPDYVRLIAPVALSDADVRRRLGPGEGLLLIVKSSFYTFTFAVTRDAFDWSASQTVWNGDRVSIARVRCDVDAQTCPPSMKPSPVFDRVTAYELYRQLIQPVEATLKSVRTLYVTTSGQLSDLPFPALITAMPEGPDTEQALLDAPWLSDRFALVSLPSVAALHARSIGPHPRARSEFVGYGAPVLSDAGAARAMPAEFAAASTRDDVGLADPTKLKQLPSLPGTAVELKAMAQVLGAPSDAIHLGSGATEHAVRADPRIAEARVVAFATHGILPGELEGFAEPGLVLTPPTQATPVDDGILSASEVAAMKLSADWVILSACNTATAGDGGAGESGGGDALSALARAFLYAGADALLASRWRVGDAVTAALTVETLANARANPQAGRAAALQAAMHAVRTGKRADGSPVSGWTPDWTHPAAWAPFSFISDGQ